MCCEFAFLSGASRVIMIDSNWRLDYVKEKCPKAEILDYGALPRGTSVTSKLMKMVPRGPDGYQSQAMVLLSPVQVPSVMYY